MLVAGLMSGTSADGIDVALVEITGLEWQTRIRVRAIHFVPYPPAVRRRILKIAGGSSLPASEISQMNCLLGELFARACLKACRQAGIPKKRLGLIGSHGQTVYHQNEVSRYCEMPVRSTFQIGEPAVIAERTGVTTIGDFRTADVAAGGRGAPLVPYLDYRLYRHPRRGRVVINIGGIANLTAIPAGGTPEEVIAFDTGPGNMLLDALAELATKGKQHYDAAGKLAAQGTISETLVRRLLRRAYFRLPPPKTTGREQFGRDYLKRFLATGKFNSSRNRRKDALATATALTAESIARSVKKFVLPKFPVHDCIVSGGGVKNLFLMKELRRRLSAGQEKGSAELRVFTSDSTGIPSGGKEAIAFAVLAYHTLNRRPSSLRAATGARHPAILGKVAYANE